MSVRKKNKIYLLTIVILCAIITIISILIISKLSVLHNTNSTPILQGTIINGLNISGLSKAEAVEAVNSYISNKAENFTITMRHNDNVYILDKDDYTINRDIQTIVEMTQQDNMKYETLKALDYFKNNGNSITVAFNYIFQGLDEKIDNICQQIEIQPINSTITFHPNDETMFHITDSKTGLLIDRKSLYDQINEQMVYSNNILIDLKLETAEPEISKEDNLALTNLVSTFSTNVSDSTGGRKNNVILALSKFNGMTINPGESVSFNNVTAPHTLEAGYEIATIILNGRFVDGIGGGICQASTTLYNALLLSGITIDEVHKHTLPVRYVPLALDAMVTEGGSDLKFTNNSDYPIFIKTSSTADDVTVEIYSKAFADGVTYSTRSETIRTLPALEDRIIPDSRKEYTDHVIFKGETYRLTYPREGYEVVSYLQTWQNGELLKEEVIRRETYQPQPGIIMEGILEPIDGMNIIPNTTE